MGQRDSLNLAQAMDPEAELLDIFLRELRGGETAAQQALAKLAVVPGDTPSVLVLESFFHRIAGTAASVGLAMLGVVADGCERAARLVKRGTLPLTDALPFFDAGLKAVQAVFAEHERHAPDSAAAPTTVTLPPEVPQSATGARILVIDDDPFSAGMIERCLRGAGFRTTSVLHAQDAFTSLDTDPPDLIILDVMMPEMNGFELCRQVRSRANTQLTPILFVTRSVDLEQRLAGLAAGANDYVAKPFEPQELVARVKSHLARLSSLQDMAVRDGLTGCYNQRYFQMRLTQEVARAERDKVALTLALLDIDHFKKVNDQHGHPAGDAVLSQLVKIVGASVRSSDVIARCGGEEFAVILTDTPLEIGERVAQRIRERVEKHRFRLPPTPANPSPELRVTVSVGMTYFSPADDTAKLVSRADAALYGSKAGGRNQVQIRSPEASSS
ncbi:MAG: diguanylate cyclase [Myxococcaceae bacterium]